MSKITKIMSKNLKLLVRSKASALVIIFGPLLIIFLVGLAFDTGTSYRVNIGVYSEHYSNLSDTLVQNLGEKHFELVRYDTDEACKDAIKQGSIHTCMVFSPDFTVGHSMKNKIMFYVDYSKINLVWMIIDSVSEQIEHGVSDISLTLTEELLKKLHETHEDLDEQKPYIAKLVNLSYDIYPEGAAMQATVDGMKFYYANLEDVYFNGVVNRAEAMKYDFDDFYKEIDNLIVEVDSIVASVQKEVNSIPNVSTQTKMRVSDGLSDIQYELTSLPKALNKTHEEVADDNDKQVEAIKGVVDTMMDRVEGKIEMLNEELAVLNATRLKIGPHIRKINDTVAVALQNLDVMGARIEMIQENIDSVTVKSAAHIVSPITMDIQPITARKTYLNYFFPSLILLVIMFVALLLSSTLVVMEKNVKAYFMNFITPTTDFIYVFSTYFTSMLLLSVQVGLVLGATSLFFKSQIMSVIWSVLLILFFVTTLFTFIGMIIGYFFNSQETALIASISVGSVLLLVSNMILPMESMPLAVVEIAQYNPFVIFESILRKILLFNISLLDMWPEIFMVLKYVGLALLLVLGVQKLTKRHYIIRYAKQFAPKEIVKPGEPRKALQ